MTQFDRGGVLSKFALLIYLVNISGLEIASRNTVNVCVANMTEIII